MYEPTLMYRKSQTSCEKFQLYNKSGIVIKYIGVGMIQKLGGL